MIEIGAQFPQSGPIAWPNIHCFGEESCFSLAFGMTMTVLTVAIVAFAVGKNFYITKAPEGSTIVQATCSIFVSFYNSYFLDI